MQGTKLYVGNLSYSATAKDVEDLFAQHGSVVSVRIMERKGFGFVEMSSQAEAEEAREKLNGTELMGRPLKVDEAKPPSDSKKRSFRG